MKKTYICKLNSEYMALKLENQKEFILNYYAKDPNASKIARILGEYQQPVANLIKKYLDVKSLNPDPGNISYFSNIDSHSKAYILGFIAADGSLVKTKSSYALTITIKHTDISVLEFIKSEIGNEHKIQDIKRPSSFDPNKMIHHSRFTFSNKTLSNDLLRLGIIPNKSLSMGNIINNIPYEYRNSFIIGYFDGDGSVSKITTTKKKFNKTEGIVKSYPCYNLSITMRGTTEFLYGICDHLQINRSFVRKYDSIPVLSFANKKDVLKLFNCYKNLDFFLLRKYNVFLERVNHSSYDKYK